jgi:hypothetical protein
MTLFNSMNHRLECRQYFVCVLVLLSISVGVCPGLGGFDLD